MTIHSPVTADPLADIDAALADYRNALDVETALEAAQSAADAVTQLLTDAQEAVWEIERHDSAADERAAASWIRSQI